MIKDSNIWICIRCYHTWKQRKKKIPKQCPKCHSPYWNKLRQKASKELILSMKETIINIHNSVIRVSGGEKGIRDDGGIYNSAYKILNYQIKHSKKPSLIGAFILEEFAKRHYFIDGNKRTAYVLAKMFMLINNYHLKLEYNEAIKFLLEIAKYESRITLEEIQKRIEENGNSIESRDIEIYLNKVFVNLILRDENGKE